MRGKHAKASANRRERTELEQRATRAEQRADRLDKDLATIREDSKRQVDNLRVELRQALKDRDQAAAPALTQAEERIRALMAERTEAVKQREQLQAKWDAFVRNIKDVLSGMGLTNVEAMEVLLATIMPDGSARTVHDGSGKATTAQQVIAVQRARGARNSVDLLADRKPTA